MTIFGCWWQNFYLCDIYWMMVPNAKLNRWSESWLFKWPEASPISLTCRWQLLINTFCRWQWCWWHRYVGDFFRYVGDFLYVLNRSPTSWIGHQHFKLVTNTFGLQHPSPTSMILPLNLGRSYKKSWKIMKIIQLSQIEIKLNSLTSDQ